jgi:hypothetical protein
MEKKPVRGILMVRGNYSSKIIISSHNILDNVITVTPPPSRIPVDYVIFSQTRRKICP